MFWDIADVVSIHTPLTSETKNMIGRTEFDCMKKSSFLINVSRASIVNEDALYNVFDFKNNCGCRL